MDAKTMAADGADTVRGTARFIGISERQVYRLIAGRKLASLRAGTRVLVPRRSAREYIAQQLEQAQSRRRSERRGPVA